MAQVKYDFIKWPLIWSLHLNSGPNVFSILQLLIDLITEVNNLTTIHSTSYQMENLRNNTGKCSYVRNKNYAMR